MRIALGTLESAPWIMDSVRMKPKDEGRALLLVERHQSELLLAWKEMHRDRT